LKKRKELKWKEFHMSRSSRRKDLNKKEENN